MRNNSFARFAQACDIFVHFAAVLVLSTSWSDVLLSCVEDVSFFSSVFLQTASYVERINQ